MPRPSQCPACMCFGLCLYPNEPDCAERADRVDTEAERDVD